MPKINLPISPRSRANFGFDGQFATAQKVVMAQDVGPGPSDGSLVLGSVHKIRERGGTEEIIGNFYTKTHIVAAPLALSDSPTRE